MKRVKVAIIEPSLIVAEGIEAVVRRSPDYDVVCNVRTVAEYHARRSGDVDVVFVALSHAHEELGAAPKIGIQTSLTEADVMRQVSTIVSLYSTEEEIVKALGESVDTPATTNFSDSHELSDRERDVLVLVAKGYTNKEIASELFISPHTVISHRKNIVHKTGIRSVAGLTVYAVLNKLIDSEQL